MPAIPDPRAALAFAGRLLAESPGSCFFAMARGLWIQRFGRREILPAESPDSTIGLFFNRIDEFRCELMRIGNLGASVYALPNPALPGDRPLNRWFQLGRGEGVKTEDIPVLRWATLDIDPTNRRPHENARNCQREACRTFLDDLLSGSPEVAKSCLSGSSGNGAHALVRLPDLENSPANRAAVRAFVRELATRHPATIVPIPADEVLASPEPDRFTGAEIECSWTAVKTVGVPGTLKSKAPHSPCRPRRVVTLDDDGRDVPPFDLHRWFEANGVAVEVREHDEDESAGVPVAYSTASRKRRAAACKAWLEGQEPAVEGQNGSGRTFSLCKRVVFRVWGASTDELLAVMADWNRRCSPPWSEAELRRKIDDARKTVKPPRQETDWEGFELSFGG